jgi:hypothetical protein
MIFIIIVLLCVKHVSLFFIEKSAILDGELRHTPGVDIPPPPPPLIVVVFVIPIRSGVSWWRWESSTTSRSRGIHDHQCRPYLQIQTPMDTVAVAAWLVMSASCRVFPPPKTTDMPTCQHHVADTTQTMSATLHRVGSSDAVSVSCRHDDLPTCRRLVELRLSVFCPCTEEHRL